MATTPPADRCVRVYDVAIIGGGPAGATCATLCAGKGMRVLLLERSSFPREKVCGDCVNPLAFGVVQQLGVDRQILSGPHARLEAVQFVGIDGHTVRVILPLNTHKIALPRSVLDTLLLERARISGADVRQNSTLTSLKRTDALWTLHTEGGNFSCRELVAADGRNSTVARLLGMMPAPVSDHRVGLQAHFKCPENLASDIVMKFTPLGYAGLAPVGLGLANLCLVGKAEHLKRLKKWAADEHGISEAHPWRTITPLQRRPIPPTHERLWLTGDTARVVEPFTGEGIAYAMRSGALCAEALANGDPSQYARSHASLYHGRLWLNDLARLACLRPGLGSLLIRAGTLVPALFEGLTRCVMNGGE